MNEKHSLTETVKPTVFLALGLRSKKKLPTFTELGTFGPIFLKLFSQQLFSSFD
jgi:hypothetical protein